MYSYNYHHWQLSFLYKKTLHKLCKYVYTYFRFIAHMVLPIWHIYGLHYNDNLTRTIYVVNEQYYLFKYPCRWPQSESENSFVYIHNPEPPMAIPLYTVLCDSVCRNTPGPGGSGSRQKEWLRSATARRASQVQVQTRVDWNTRVCFFVHVRPLYTHVKWFVLYTCM